MIDSFVACIGTTVFIASCVLVVLLLKYGMGTTSYEEAVAEQRQQIDSLWGQQQRRSKNKEKKLKKIGKKVKEKQAITSSNKSEPEEEEEEEDDDDEEAESDKQSLTETETSTTTSESIRHHVEFQEEPATIEESPVKENVVKKRLKRDKVRPILVNRDMSEETVVLDETCETPSANHFELLHPKDEFELLHAHIQEKINKSKQNVEASTIETKNKKASKQTVEEAAAPPVVVTEVQTEVSVESTKAGKKIAKQTDEVVLAAPPVVVEKEESVAVIPPTESLSTTSAKEKKKKKSELSSIHQLTGDKQGVSLAVLNTLVRKAELSRSEIQILIDVLLNKQHGAPAVLDEWSEGKADPVQKLKKQLAEREKSLAEEQEALGSAQAKLKEVRAEQAAERSQLQQRTRALEETLQAKQLECQSANNHLHSINQKLQQLQAQLNEEMMKSRKLMEEHAALQMQRQQLEHHLAQTQEAQGTVAQLQNDLQELQAHNNQLTKELITINEQKDHQQATIVQYQHQLGHFTKDTEQKNEIIRQMEDAHTELERRLSMSHKQENDLTMEISQLKSNCQQQLEEIRRLELNNSQSLNEIRHFQERKDGSENLIFKLNSEVKQLQDEKFQLETGSSEESKSHKIEVMNLHNEISSAKTQLQQTEKKHAVDLETTLRKFQAEIEELKNKNNVTIAKVRQEEQQTYMNLIQRLFPSIKLNDGVPQEQWIPELEKGIRDHVSSLWEVRLPEQTDNSEVAKLQAQLLNYKSVIDDTEGVLKKLEARAEQTENNWREEMKIKEAEIAALKQQHVQQLQTELATLETQLRAEQEAKERLTEECDSYKTRSKLRADDMSQVEKLFEEVNRLSEELRVERTKSADLQTQIDDTSEKTQNHNSSNGPSISIENNGN